MVIFQRMAKTNHRETLLDAGLDVFYRNGFHASGVQDVVSAAGVPKGSFYNHFESKDALAAAALDRYWESNASVRDILLDASLPPLERLDNHLSAFGFHEGGCLIGNFSAELANVDGIRVRLAELFELWAEPLAKCIEDGQTDGSIRSDLSASQLAKFIVSSWEGAILNAKVERGRAPLDSAREVLLTLLMSGHS